MKSNSTPTYYEARIPMYPYGAHWEKCLVVSEEEANRIADSFVTYDEKMGYSIFWAGQYILVWDKR